MSMSNGELCLTEVVGTRQPEMNIWSKISCSSVEGLYFLFSSSSFPSLALLFMVLSGVLSGVKGDVTCISLLELLLLLKTVVLDVTVAVVLVAVVVVVGREVLGMDEVEVVLTEAEIARLSSSALLSMFSREATIALAVLALFGRTELFLSLLSMFCFAPQYLTE